MLALLPALMLASMPAQAESVGNLRSVAASASRDGVQGWDLQTDKGARLRIELPATDIIRVQAGRNGTLTGAGDKAAPIVLPQPKANVQAKLEEDAQEIRVRTESLVLHVQRQPLRMRLERLDNGQPTALWQELQPLDLDATQSVQVLSSQADEGYFGGGQQNGRYQFKGRELEVSYSGGWEEGDRPSPAPMLLSSRGWGMLRNTWSDGSYDLREADQSTLLHREDRFDAYYFVGTDLPKLIERYTQLTGRPNMVARWALSYGDADCYNDGDNSKKPGTVPEGWSDGPTGTTPDVIDSVAKQYRAHDMPGGWILPNDGYGCGYKQLPETVKGLAGYGFRTGLWTENGVDKIAWEVGKAGSRVQKLDVAWTGKGYQFAMDANRQAFNGILDNSDSRPFLWTVMGWAGIQRYAVAWTGDQSSSWDYIRWHVPTLVGSGLSGMAYASGDVDAIFGGSAETFTRDLQWKAFTPVLMGMSGWSSNARKHPWWYDEPYRSINRDYLKLKMRLTPYMYGLVHEAAQTGAPPVRGLMWDNPRDPHAQDETYKYQFLLGRDLLVAPVYRSQAASRGWRRDIHLPAGGWIDYWDGRRVQAGADGRQLDRQVDLATLPVFVRAGAILPMYPSMLFDGEKPLDEVTFDLYPQGESQYTLYEDDGNTRRYQQGESSTQQIRVQAPAQGSGPVQVQIDPVQGQYNGQLPQRRYGLRVPSRGHAAVSPALHHGVAVAMAASRAKASCSCCSQPGAGTLSGASTATSMPSQARSISSRWATSPSGRARRVYSACSGVCANQCSTACAGSTARRRVRCRPLAARCRRWLMPLRSTLLLKDGTSMPPNAAAPCMCAPPARTSASPCNCSWTSRSPPPLPTTPIRPRRCSAANCRPTACWWSTARPKSPATRWKTPSMMTRVPGSAVCATRPCAPVRMNG